MKKSRLKVFISGGIEEFEALEQQRAFNQAETRLTNQGHTPINPNRYIHKDLNYDDRLKICFLYIELSDVIYMLDNWRDSSVARYEHSYALTLDKKIVYQMEESCSYM